MAKVILSLKEKTLAEISLNKETTSIGRDPKNDIDIANPSVSRFHAKILNISGEFYIEDLKSTNGTFLNERKIVWRAGLKNNDKITVGKYTLTFVEEKGDKKRKSPKLAPDMMDATVPLSDKKK